MFKLNPAQNGSRKPSLADYKELESIAKSAGNPNKKKIVTRSLIELLTHEKKYTKKLIKSKDYLVKGALLWNDVFLKYLQKKLMLCNLLLPISNDEKAPHPEKKYFDKPNIYLGLVNHVIEEYSFNTTGLSLSKLLVTASILKYLKTECPPQAKMAAKITASSSLLKKAKPKSYGTLNQPEDSMSYSGVRKLEVILPGTGSLNAAHKTETNCCSCTIS